MNLKRSDMHRGALNVLMSTCGGIILFLLIYAVVWTIVPYFSNSGLPVDTVEEVAWSREWPLGIYRHPPMMVWMAGIAWTAMRGWIGSPYVLSGVSFGLGVFFLYLLVRAVRPASQAGLAAMLTPLVYFFGPQLPQWNANIVQLPFVGLFLFAAWKGVMERSLPLLLVAGLAAGGGVISKYSFGLIVVFAAVALLADRTARSRIVPLHIALSFVAFLIPLVPHAWWFFHAPVNTLDYLEMSVEKTESGSVWGHILSPALVVGEFLLLLLPAMLISRQGVERTDTGLTVARDADRSLKFFLSVSVIGPVLGAALVGAVGGGFVKDQWLIAYILPAPALVVILLLDARHRVAWRTSAATFYLIALAALVIAYPAERELHYLRGHGGVVNWTPLMPPGPLTDAALSFWNEARQKNGLPPTQPAIISGGWEAAAIINSMPVRPTWLEHLDAALSPWVSDAMIRKDGLLATETPSKDFIARYDLCVAAQTQYQWHNGHGGTGLVVPLTVLLPNGLCHSGS